MKYSAVWQLFGVMGLKPYEQAELIFKTVREKGYDGIEIWGDTEKVNAEQIKELAQSYELEISNVTGMYGPLGDILGCGRNDLASPQEEYRKNALKYSKKLVPMVANLGAKSFNIGGVSAQPLNAFEILPVEPLKKNFVQTAREICKYASEYDIRVLIEPIDRFMAYTGFAGTIADALELIERIDMENTGILADMFHMNIEEASIPEAIERGGEKILHVHCQDSNALLPGLGHIDFKGVMTALKKINFKGHLSMESYLPYPFELEKFLEMSITYLKGIEMVLEHSVTTVPVPKHMGGSND